MSFVRVYVCVCVRVINIAEGKVIQCLVLM